MVKYCQGSLPWVREGSCHALLPQHPRHGVDPILVVTALRLRQCGVGLHANEGGIRRGANDCPQATGDDGAAQLRGGTCRLGSLEEASSNGLLGAGGTVVRKGILEPSVGVYLLVRVRKIPRREVPATHAAVKTSLLKSLDGGKFVVGFEGAHTVENLAQDTSAETFVQATDAALGDDFTGHRDWVGPDAAELDAHLDLPLAPRELRNRARAGQRSVSRHKFRRATAPCPSAG